jgi:diguanylate cyclase (GGDEF)-like protein
VKDPEINPSEFDILVCDDESSIRSMLGEALSGWGFNVQTAPSGEAALEHIAAGHVPHVVLTDIRMGGMTGIQLAGHIKKISEEIEVVIMTSHGSFDTAVQAMRLGVYDYLSKPFDDIRDVRTVISHVCKRIYMRFYTEYLVRELEQKNKETTLLAETGESLGESLDINKVMNVACERISLAFGNAPTAFFQFSPKESCLRMRYRHPEAFLDGVELSIPVDAAENEIESALAHIRENHVFGETLRDILGSDPATANRYEFRTSSLKPRGIPQGVFCVFWPIGEEWGEGHDLLLQRYTQLVGTSFENALLHAKVLSASIRDGLTGLFNVRHFKERMGTELRQLERLKSPSSFIFFDVDHFKKYNDTNGHPAGDEVLRTMGALLKKFFRTTDIVARYGGEEFVVAMPHTPLASALKKAEAFRKLIEETPFAHGEKQPLGKVTVSIGVSEYPSHGANLDAVLKAADDALYEGKKASRNVVVSAKADPSYIKPF